MKTTINITDDIMVKGLPATAGSKMLEGFNAPFSATVVQTLLAAGYEIKSAANMPFGFYDLFSNDTITPRGLSLFNDYCGAVKFFAAQSGTIFLHPTYGRVSRHGLIQAVSSMDQIGIAAELTQEAFTVLEAISGKDEKDTSTYAEKFRIDSAISAPKSSVVSYTKEELKLWAGVFFILACSELSNNISRYDGIKFGHRTADYSTVSDLYLNSRKEGFAPSVKLAAIAGTIFLSKDYYSGYYDKSSRLRRLLKKDIEARLAARDVLLYEFDLDLKLDFDTMGLFALSALTGLPSLTFSKDGKGYMAISRAFGENDLLAYIKKG